MVLHRIITIGLTGPTNRRGRADQRGGPARRTAAPASSGGLRVRLTAGGCKLVFLDFPRSEPRP